MNPRNRPLLSDLILNFLGNLDDSPRTRSTYTTGLNVFQRFLAETDNRSNRESPARFTIGQIDTDVLQNFQVWLAQKDYSRFSQRTYLSGVVALLHYGLAHDMLPGSFSLERARAKLKHITRRSAYPIPRPDPSLPRIIEWYDRLPVPEGDDEKSRKRRLRILRSRAFVHLLYSSAGRLAEIASLNRKEVGDGRRKEAVVTGKGDKQRYIFITPEARAAIQAYVTERSDQFEPLFISHGKDYGRRLSHDSLWNTVRNAARKLAIDASPHDFRHFRASQMLEQGAPLEAIQEILGHSDISTTRRVYAHYSKPAIRAIFERTTLTPEDAAKTRLEEGRDPEFGQS